MDLVAISIRESGKQLICSTGLAFEIPEGYAGFLFPRSSIVRTDVRLANAVGVIDADYRGELSIVFDLQPSGGMTPTYTVGDRVAQLVIMPVATVELQLVDDLEDTERGTGGYGSTGK